MSSLASDRAIFDQAARLRELAEERSNRLVTTAARPTCRAIAVTSGKGGVGKTNLAVNLGIALAQRGLRTVLLDADLGLANVDVILGISPKYNLGHVLMGGQSLRDIVCEGPGGLKILAGGSGIYELANLSEWRLGKFIASLNQLDRDFDIILVDTGAGVSRNVLSFALASDEVIAVTTPEPTSLTDVYGVMKLIVSRNSGAPLKLVINMVQDSSDAEGARKRLELVTDKFLGVGFEYLGWIPLDSCVSKAVKKQEPVILAYPRCDASKAARSIADALIGRNENVGSQHHGIGRLFAKMVEYVKKG